MIASTETPKARAAANIFMHWGSGDLSSCSVVKKNRRIASFGVSKISAIRSQRLSSV
jgi:hypothetical protein